MDYHIIRNDDIIAAYVPMEAEHNYAYEHEQAYKLLKSLMWDFYEEDTDKLQMEKGVHGKPYFVDSDVRFNVSHCRGMAVCAISKKFHLGIDAENIRLYRENVAKRIMTEQELCELETAEDKDVFFFRIWTGKESLVKLSGDGITKELNKIEVLTNQLIIGRYEVICGEEKFIISIAAEVTD